MAQLPPNSRVDGYIIQRRLGAGAFGVTYSATDSRGQLAAMKFIDLHQAGDHGVRSGDIIQEITALRDLTGNNCSKYLACYHDSFVARINGRPFQVIVSDYLKGQSLRDFLKSASIIQPRQLWKYYKQLLGGLNYIHSLRYAHRDIKPENLILTQENKIKYIDFGLTCLVGCKSELCTACRGRGGTILYMPPEFFNKYLDRVQMLAQANHRAFRAVQIEPFAHDVWSTAMVCCELAWGNLTFPFQFAGREPTQVLMINIGRAPQFFRKYPQDAKVEAFLRYICVNNYVLRPRSEQIVEYLRQVRI